MTDVVVGYNLPVVASDQRPIKHMRVEFRVSESAEWTFQDNATPDKTEFVFQDYQAGQIFVRLTVVDMEDEESTPLVVFGSQTLQYRGPGQPTNVTIRFV